MKIYKEYDRMIKSGVFSKVALWITKYYDKEEQGYNQLLAKRYHNFRWKFSGQEKRFNTYMKIAGNIEIDSALQLAMIFLEIENGFKYNKDQKFTAFIEEQLISEFKNFGFDGNI